MAAVVRRGKFGKIVTAWPDKSLQISPNGQAM
jgi:hypothetical protein